MFVVFERISGALYNVELFSSANISVFYQITLIICYLSVCAFNIEFHC